MFGPDIRPFPIVCLMIAAQIYVAYLAQEWSWPFLVFVAWSFGGTVTHSLALMTHELSHNLMFKTRVLNDYFAIFCNVAMGIPSSRYYHTQYNVSNLIDSHQLVQKIPHGAPSVSG